MKNSIVVTIGLWGFAFGFVQAKGEITWEDRQITLKPTIQDKQASGHFKFQNVGANPVEFLSVKPSCGCTTAKMQKTTYQAGERGVIDATFTVGTRSGLQQKSIAVQTTDPTSPVTILTLRVFLPDVIHLSSDRINWTVGEPAVAKKINIEVINHAFNITKVSSTNDSFVPELRIVEPGKSYEVSVTPTSTQEVTKGSIRVQTDSLEKPLYHILSFINKQDE